MFKLHRPRVSENQDRKALEKAEDGRDKLYGNPRREEEGVIGKNRKSRGNRGKNSVGRELQLPKDY